MNPSRQGTDCRFVVATPARSVCDDNARALERHGLLKFIALGTRRGTTDVPPERTRLNPFFGLFTYFTARLLSNDRAESLRFRLHPLFDRWVRRQLAPGDHIISSYGYANACFSWVRQRGGKTFLDGGNSHPQNYRQVIAEEHRRWNSPAPALPEHHYRRSVEMLEHVDYVLSPSSYVTRSFVERGFRPAQILRNVYPLNLSCFSPAKDPRPESRPLTLISTGSLSLRKGTPYLLEAFRIVRQKIPKARLLLTRIAEASVMPVLARHADLPIEWAEALPHQKLAERLRSADIFLLPSLEDGFARTVAEALACGLPVITTPNTGASDLIQPGVNGEVVPLRDPQAIANATWQWAEKILSPGWQPRLLVDVNLVSFEHFERQFLNQLRERGLIS
jgi:glycosyltransferase involved in cell wall biosynthesis